MLDMSKRVISREIVLFFEDRMTRVVAIDNNKIIEVNMVVVIDKGSDKTSKMVTSSGASNNRVIGCI